MLVDLLGAEALDPRIRTDAWLFDALISLTGTEQIPSSAGAALSRQRAIGLVTQARLDVNPE